MSLVKLLVELLPAICVAVVVMTLVGSEILLKLYRHAAYKSLSANTHLEEEEILLPYKEATINVYRVDEHIVLECKNEFGTNVTIRLTNEHASQLVSMIVDKFAA